MSGADSSALENVKQNKIYGLSSFSGMKEIVQKALQFCWKKKRTKETENIEEVNTSHIIFISDYSKQLTKNHNSLVHTEWQIVITDLKFPFPISFLSATSAHRKLGISRK